MTKFVNNLIKVLITLGGIGCFVASFWLHREKSNEWGWFLFVGLIVTGTMLKNIATEDQK